MAERNQGGVAERRPGGQSEGIFDTVSDAAQSAASGVGSVAGQAWDSTARGARQAASAVSHTAEDAWESMRGCMSRYPIATFLTGVGLGALFVLALQRRSEWSSSMTNRMSEAGSGAAPMASGWTR